MSTNDFSFKTVLKNFLEAFNIQKGIIPTLKDLLMRPSKVITSYIDGEKDVYFAPGRFFVTILAFLSFLTWITGGFNSELYKSIISMEVQSSDSLLTTPIINDIVDNFLYIINNATYRLPLLILPSAYISWIVFYKYRYNVAKHFVIHIYCWTFINLILALASLFIDQEQYLKVSVGGSKTWQQILYEWFYYIFPLIYYIHALKNIFKLSTLGAFIKPVLFVATTLGICFVAIILFLTGTIIRAAPDELLYGKERIIILSKASKNYAKWMEEEDVIVLDAYTINNTDSILALADGIILTGGEDINPLEYNNTTNISVCGPINYSRDTLERKLFDFAFKNKLPLVGVCRGMQMMNVASGGTLYGDIPTEIGTEVIHRNNGEVMHEIVLSSENTYYTSLIFPLKKDTFLVNSWHHQGLKDIGPNIHIVARSYDGLPEAAIMDTSAHPFMIAVQFHPERLGKDNAIHQQMRSSFFDAISK